MDFAADKYQKDLARIKDDIRESYNYFEENYKRFNEYRKFVFESTLSQSDRMLLQALERPQLEFNIVEAYVSRILGEFAKQKPSVKVGVANPETANPMTIKFVEEHLRSILDDRENKHKIYEIAKDVLSGGFSAAKVYTDYTSEMSMTQMINFDRVFDPTLCGWDPVSKYSHKGDGRYCFEMIPKTKQEVKELYPKLNIDRFTYAKNIEGFSWSYKSNKNDIILLVDFYEKKKRKVKIVQLNDGRIMRNSEFKKILDEWDSRPFNDLLLPPWVVNERYTVLETINRYRICENKVLEYEETDYRLLPIPFVDGNSIKLRPIDGGEMKQVTRPYVYHARGAQRLKNLSGISLANEIENTVQHKFMIKEEALPNQREYLQGWKQFQKPSLMVYKGYLDNDPERPIPDPVSPVPRIGAPAEIVQAFGGADSLIQTILGNYDGALGINDNQLSGRAIQKAALHSNAVVMPYIVGIMHGIQRIAQIYVSLMPKYYRTPVTLPAIDDRGKRYYVKLDRTNDILNFDDNILNVTVEAGASFEVQKEQTFEMVKELMQVSQLFAQFVNEKGLDFVLNLLDGYGIDQLKEQVDGWVKQQEAQQAQAQQNNPEVMKQQLEQEKLQFEREKLQLTHTLEVMKSQQQQSNEEMKMQMEQVRSQTELARQQDKQQLERMQAEVDMYNKQMELELKKLEIEKQCKEVKDEKTNME